MHRLLSVVPSVTPATPETSRGAFNKREIARELEGLVENTDVNETANPDETSSQPAAQKGRYANQYFKSLYDFKSYPD